MSEEGKGVKEICAGVANGADTRGVKKCHSECLPSSPFLSVVQLLVIEASQDISDENNAYAKTVSSSSLLSSLLFFCLLS